MQPSGSNDPLFRDAYEATATWGLGDPEVEKPGEDVNIKPGGRTQQFLTPPLAIQNAKDRPTRSTFMSPNARATVSTMGSMPSSGQDQNLGRAVSPMVTGQSESYPEKMLPPLPAALQSGEDITAVDRVEHLKWRQE